ncbi:MAG: fatty acid desaturase [Phycisphaeraceae bacterium]|nr:fatty acid desaturase [Phycisphaeraceae bacterium]
MNTQPISELDRGVAAPCEPRSSSVRSRVFAGAVLEDPAAASVGSATSPAEHRETASRRLIIINLITVLLPFAGLAAAIGLLWGIAFDWYYLAILVGMWLISAFGITIGFHRLCTHKAFKTPAVLRYLFAAAGSMAVQGPVIRWCAEHRKHHQHSDAEGDPHSPHMSAQGSWGEGVFATLRGAFHAHLGWLFGPASKGLGKYSRDLRDDPAIALADRQFVFWVLFGLAFPAAVGGLLSMSWGGVLLGFLWGGLVRILLVHHITWSVNSVCHLWGSKPFESRDESRNNAIVGLLALGEGWHNNHHAFPTSARHGLRWWEFDLSYCFIRTLQLFGLASEVRQPDAVRIASKKRNKA